MVVEQQIRVDVDVIKFEGVGVLKRLGIDNRNSFKIPASSVVIYPKP